MRNESHTLISTLLGVVNQWRRREGWSRETVVQHIVEAHERIQGALVTGIVFDPPTRDTTERMKVNADRVFRWLDDGTKDTNLVPANFVPSILAALPTDLKVQALGDILTPLGVSVRLIGGDAGQRPEVLCMLEHSSRRTVRRSRLLPISSTAPMTRSCRRPTGSSPNPGRRPMRRCE